MLIWTFELQIFVCLISTSWVNCWEWSCWVLCLSVLILLRNSQAFQRCCPVRPSYQQWEYSVREFQSPTLLPALVTVHLFNYSHPSGYKVIYDCGFDFHYTNDIDVEYLFMRLLAIYIFLWRNLFKSFCPYFKLNVSFYYWVMGSWYWVFLKCLYHMGLLGRVRSNHQKPPEGRDWELCYVCLSGGDITLIKGLLTGLLKTNKSTKEKKSQNMSL